MYFFSWQRLTTGLAVVCLVSAPVHEYAGNKHGSSLHLGVARRDLVRWIPDHPFCRLPNHLPWPIMEPTISTMPM